MNAETARVVAHLIALLWCIYFAFDERASQRMCRAWVWGALAAERLAILALLVWDIGDAGMWMEWRPALAPFIIFLAGALSVYGIRRIRYNRSARRMVKAA